MNIALLVGVTVLALVVIAWTVRKNRSDRRNLQDKLNRDYTHPRHDQQDPDAEEPVK